ncbi:hypothetical protein MUP35_04000 [Patescibacteria group bacterium]|nr:hypothetical protein [Patescibacteria group bacterium]
MKSLLISAFLLFAFAGVAKAGNLMIQGIDMPSWVNWEPLYISYTALEAEGNPVKVKGFIKKDGEGWQFVGESDKLSASFEINRSFYPGDGLYKIYFEEVNSGDKTPEESFNVDFSAPSGVSEYSKERKDAFVYKICWKNPDNDDFDRVIIFRSEKTDEGFDKVAEVSGSKNEEKCHENGTPDNKTYYYVIRAIDHAGNASSTVGDSEVTNVQVLGTTSGATPSLTPAVVNLPLSEVTGEQQAQEGQILGGTTDEGEISQPGVIQQVTQKVAGLGWLRILGIVVIILGIVILLVSLLKKRQ